MVPVVAIGEGFVPLFIGICGRHCNGRTEVPNSEFASAHFPEFGSPTTGHPISLDALHDHQWTARFEAD